MTSSRSSRTRSPIRPKSPTPTPRRPTRRSPARIRTSARPKSATCSRSCFRTRREAEAAEAKIKAGASFDDIVKDRGLKTEDTDIGETTKDAMIDKAEADAVFALPQGGVSGVLKSQFGPVIVRVKGITPSTVKPYAEVADEVKRQVSASHAGDKIQALHDKIEDARVSGQIARRSRPGGGPDAQTVAAVDAQGRRSQGQAGQPARQGRAPARRLRLRRRARRGAAANQGRRLRLVRRHQGRSVARSHLRGGEARGRGAMARRRDRQGARRQGGRSRQAARRRREHRRPREERGRRGENGDRRPSRRTDEPAGIGRRRDLPPARGRRGLRRDARRAGDLQDHRRPHAAGRSSPTRASRR